MTKNGTHSGQNSLLPSSAGFLETSVVEINEISADVFLLSLEKKFDFRAGQVVGIHFEPRPDARLYSIASGEKERYLKILFNIQPGGMLTPRLASCKKGDTLFTTTPFGWFTCNSDAAWWIASGTGIAPFASMFYSGLSENKILIHGGRSPDSFYFQEDFQKVMKDRYIRCCSGEHKEGLYNGRLTGYLKNLDNLPVNQTYYLCGRVEMVIEVRDILMKKGIPYRNILSEIYF